MDDKSRSRLAATLEKVINTEVSLRTGDLNLVEQNINSVREYLNKLRQGVCADYYDDNFKTTLQKPPHRAVKNTFKGKTPIKSETDESGEDLASTSYDHRSQVNAKRRDSLADRFGEVTIKAEPPDDYDQNCSGSNTDAPQLKYVDPEEKLLLAQEVEKRRPRYIPPVLPIDQIQQSLEPRGNKLMKKVRFLVRNNSKYIMTPEDTSGCTYKWSLNVKLNDESCDISDIVSKVIFYLHPSYKPNDVITLTSAPFKITRRGWGEFNLRLKIFFINEKDDPVDISHRLVFDKLCSGMETFGGETVFDHWIIDPTARIHSAAAPRGCDSPKLATIVSRKSEPPKKSPSVMNTDETSSSLLSAFFGELEEQTVKKDSEWGQDIFDLSDLAFPEFFSSPGKSSLENVPNKNEAISPQVSLPENCSSSSTEPVTTAQVESASVTDVAAEKIEVSVIHDANIEMVDNIVCEDDCVKSEIQTVEFSEVLEPAIVQQLAPESANDQKPIKTEPVEAVEEELYLSDLSMFDDEVIIADGTDCVEGPSSNNVSTIQPDHNAVDYNSVEMDDLIQFPRKSNDVILNPVPSTSGTAYSQNTKGGDNPSRPILVNDVKQNIPLDTLLRKSVGKTSPNKKTTLKNSPVMTQVTGPDLLSKPPAKVQVQTHLRPIAPSLPGRLSVPISAVLANLPSSPTNKGSVVYVVAPSGARKLSSSQVVPAQNVLASNALNRSPQTVFVSSAELPNILAAQNCTPTLVMTSPKGAKTQALRRVNPKKSIPIASTSVGSPRPFLSPTPPQRPILIKTDGKPMSLVNMASLSTNVPVSRSSILVQPPRASSQATTVLAAPSMRLSPMGVQRIRPSAPQIRPNLALAPQIRPNLAPTPQIRPNLAPAPPRSKAILVRPGGTQFLLKMPDGSLKPIKMGSLMPLQQGNAKLRIASSSSLQPMERPSRSVPLPPKSVPVQKRRPALLRHAPPAKRSRFLPPPVTPGTLSAIAGPSHQQQHHIVISPSSTSHLSNQFTKLQPGMGLPLKPAGENCHDDSADPELQGMNSLKRRPPETEAVDTSSFRNERMLIEQCPKDSVQVAVTFLLKRLPLIDVRARLDGFKQAFAYCATDLRTFRSWPFAKQRAHEVVRANDVLSLAKQAFVNCNWTRWDIVRFSRMRGFTPLTSKIDPSFLPHKPLDVPDPPTDAALNSLKALWGPEPEPDDEIDVDTVTEDVPEPRVPPVFERLDKKGKEFMTLARHVGDGSIVEKWVQDVSIYLDPEEVAPGILFPAALRLLVSTFHSFAEDLLRRSYTSAFLRYDSTEPRFMSSQDVQLALRSRPEFDLFTNVGLGTKYRQARPQPEDPSEEDRRLRNAEKVS